jgi:aminobenzoyl-glutamate transport protein
MSSSKPKLDKDGVKRSRGAKLLDWIEWLGNTLPDPTVLFVFALLITWGASWWLSRASFSDIDPRSLVRTGTVEPTPRPIVVKNQLTGEALAAFLSRMVPNFTEFPPLGVVLVAMMGVGVAEHVGMISSLIKWIMGFTPKRFLTPMLLFVAILSHVGGDAGYVLVVPLGGVLFATAGRHPIAGIAAAFAGVAGAFSASFIPSSVDPLLQSFTQAAAQIIDPNVHVNPLCNWWFMIASSGLLILVGWVITDWFVEPRLRNVKIDLSADELPRLEELSSNERRALFVSLATLAASILLLVFVCWPTSSAMRDVRGQSLTSHEAPLM